MKTRVISYAIAKGGSAKSSSTYNSGIGLASKGKNVLLIDLDPQATLTKICGINPIDYETENVAHLLVDDKVEAKQVILDITSMHQPFVKGKVHLIPSISQLKEAEKMVENGNRKTSALKIKLKPLITEGIYDYILIDTPPSFGTLTINGLVASSECIIPIQAEFIALQGTQDFIDFINALNKDLIADEKEPVRINGGLVTMYDKRTGLAKAVDVNVRENFNSLGIGCFNTIINRNVKISEAPSRNLSVMEYDPSSQGSKDYMNLVEEIISQEKE